MKGETDSDVHPDAVLESLLAKGGRSHRLENLKSVHEICRQHHASGSRDFSLPTIGRLADNAGIIKARALYNAASADYKNLIASWAVYAGPPAPKPSRALASHEYLVRIPDPAIRSIMQSIIVERDKLRNQINTLKEHTQITIDRRPRGPVISPASDSQPVFLLSAASQLTPTEREALQKAISAEYLEEHGLQEGTHGEIVNKNGRIILEIGFARAIRKILGN